MIKLELEAAKSCNRRQAREIMQLVPSAGNYATSAKRVKTGRDGFALLLIGWKKVDYDWLERVLLAVESIVELRKLHEEHDEQNTPVPFKLLMGYFFYNRKRLLRSRNHVTPSLKN